MEILILMGGLTLGLAFLGERTGIGIYFLAAIIPTLFLTWQLQQPLFYAMGVLLSAFFIWRTFNPKRD